MHSLNQVELKPVLVRQFSRVPARAHVRVAQMRRVLIVWEGFHMFFFEILVHEPLSKDGESLVLNPQVANEHAEVSQDQGAEHHIRVFTGQNHFHLTLFIINIISIACQGNANNLLRLH